MSAYVHPTAVIDEGVILGDDVKIWHFVHVSEGAQVGAGTSLGQNVFVGRGVRVGERVRVQNNVSLYEGVEVESDVFLGPSCVFTNVINPRAEVGRKAEFLPTRVARGASVGANATIVCGNTLGTYAFVGAGSVVISDVPDYAVVVGNPARQIGFMCVCGERLETGSGTAYSTRCGACDRAYRVVAGRCTPLSS